MPQLSIDLDDAADCRRGLEFLRTHLRRVHGGCGPNTDAGADEQLASRASLPLKKKLALIKERRVWLHLVEIAKRGDEARSLPEWDAQLDLPRNKMRSLKAIFAKLENRWDVRFLKVDRAAGNDDAGNPRYSMPPRIRKQILVVTDPTKK